MDKREIILLTKSDLVDSEYVETATELLKTKCDEIIPVSINDWNSMENLKKLIQ
jgi:hypothetical protein